MPVASKMVGRLKLTGPAFAAVLLLTPVPAAAGGPALVHSAASNRVVQSQPAAGSCHTIGTGPYSRPDPRCTPGALNPQVRQATIGRTICRAGWTASVRPSESITEPEKLASMSAYGDARPAHDYEYDHFVPLELGGATNDPRNLWPEPSASPNPKDRIENQLNRAVCDHRITLAQAQRQIATNWVTVGRKPPKRVAGTPKPKPQPPQPPAPPPPPTARCAASASYNSSYHDYDVYVHSNQPNQTVTVTGDGQTASWHADDSGYADVYFHAGASAAGDAVTVRVGHATCSTTL